VTPASVFHLDAFLYDDEDEQRLVDEGKISRAVCKKCGSKDTEAISELYLDYFSLFLEISKYFERERSRGYFLGSINIHKVSTAVSRNSQAILNLFLIEGETSLQNQIFMR
jgi:hypothetical protein